MVGSGYELTKAFYAEVEQNEAMQIGATAFHHSLYTWICELRNRLQRDVMDLPVKYTMQMAFIGSDKTLKKCIDDLEEWGVIEILQRGSNQHVATKVKLAIAFLRKHCESDTKANDSAIADIRQLYDSGAKAVRTTKTNKTDKTTKTTKPPPSPKGEVITELLSAFPYQSEAFKLAWREWEQFRQEQKKTLTPTSVKKQLKLLAKHTEVDAIAVLDKSICNGWQGLFELKPNSRNSYPIPPSVPSTRKPFRELP